MNAKLPILISVPHGGEKIPPELSDRIALSRRDILEDGDAFTREIYGFKNDVTAYIDTEIARACIDLNRSPIDRPPQNPDGVIKTVTTMQRLVYKPGQYPDDNLINLLLQKYYIPYHKKIDELQQKDHLKIAFDCHSMLAESPPIDKAPGTPRPLICISNRGDKNGFPDNKKGQLTCPAVWVQKLVNCFRKSFEIKQEDIKINDPFSGGYITRSHFRWEIPWIQIEINRKLYLTEPYFNWKNLTISKSRIAELSGKILSAIKNFLNDI